MDNQSFTGVDTNISLNALNGNENISGTFQDDGSLVEINFEQQNFSMQNENLFGDLNSTQISKQGFEHFNVPNQQIQNTACTGSNEMQISLQSSGVVCSVSSDLSTNETNLRVFEDASDQQFEIRSNQNNYPYQPEFPEQVKENTMSFPYAGVMQQPQEQQFVSDISSVEEFSNQFSSSLEQQFQDYQPCQPQQNDFENESNSVNSGLNSSPLEMNASEYTTKTLDPSCLGEACETRSNQFASCNEKTTEKNLLEAETPDVSSRLITETLLPAEDGQYLENGNIDCAPASPGNNADSNDLSVGKESVASSITEKFVAPNESYSVVNNVYDATQGDISKEILPCNEDPVSKIENFQDAPELNTYSSPDNSSEEGTTSSISKARLSHRTSTSEFSLHLEEETIGDKEKQKESVCEGSVNEISTTSEASIEPIQKDVVASNQEVCAKELHQTTDVETEDIESGKEISTKSEESVEPIQKDVVASNQEVFAKEPQQTTVVETEDIESGKEKSASETISCQKASAEYSAKTENNLSQEDSICESGNGMESKDDAVNDSLGMMPLSPMITMLDDNLGEDGDTTAKRENDNGSPKGTVL